MPSLSKSSYELVEATEDDLVRYTRHQNSQAWRGQLSIDQYIEREAVLGKCKIASLAVNSLKVFILRSKDNIEQPLCSCELLIRKSWKYKFNAQTQSVDRRDVLSGCVGGVFTYPEHRSKGYARIMIDHLVDIAKNKLLGPEGFTFLYSEIGEYYAKNGFKSFDVPLVHIPLGTKAAGTAYGTAPDHDHEHHEFEFVKYHQFDKLLQFHNKQYDAEVSAQVAQDHKLRVTIDPTLDYVDWFHLRSKFVSSKLFYKDHPDQQVEGDLSLLSYDQILAKFHSISPDVFGIQMTDRESGRLIGGIIWTYDWSINDETNENENYCTVLKIITDKGSSNRDELAQTLILKMKAYLESMAPKHASLEGFKKIVFWSSEVSANTLAWLSGEELKGTANISNGSRSAILINNEAEDAELINGDLIWAGNDKLPWF